MTTTTLAEGRTFIRTGKTITSLYQITAGSVAACRTGGEIILHTGDIIGICELSSPVYLFSYKTLENCTLESFPFSCPEDLSSLLAQNADFARDCLKSSFHQTQLLYEQYTSALNEASSMYQTCMEDENEYLGFCKKHRLEPKQLPSLDTLSPFCEEEPVSVNTLEYLKGFQRILETDTKAFLKEPEVLSYLIGRNAFESAHIVSLSDRIADYLTHIYGLYAANGCPDFFSLYVYLLFAIGMHAEDAPKIQEILTRITLQSENSSYSDREALHLRTAEYQRLVSTYLKKSSPSENHLDFSHSLSEILNFSTMDRKDKTLFQEKIQNFCNIKDRSSAEEETALLRKDITTLFLQLYENIFFLSLEQTELPPPVLMFLQFGYVDRTLAGESNTELLYQYSKRLAVDHQNGIYTLYRWLLAIYRGEKEPSRNSFDEDYTDCLHAQKVSGKITEEEERLLLKDQKQKVLFELHNMFPNVNKMTYGRITSYCPVFSEHSIFKSLDTAFVTADAVNKILNTAVRADFQAFYRETIYTSEDCGISKEYIHVEYLPDIILMPCVGTRGVMWQEIEGKKRTTPARMMLPVFQMEDLTSCLLHMVGEYRWEMCKRIQGGRWNDVTDRSLTSEYFDYLQFYKKSSEFTAEAKEKIKNGLQKSKNSFKEMFVRDYITWILYESTGSPRLNKTARNILFTYCPFSAAVRNELLNNPIFKESIERYDLKNKQKLHRLDNLFLKIKNSGHAVPEELEKEYAFFNL